MNSHDDDPETEKRSVQDSARLTKDELFHRHKNQTDDVLDLVQYGAARVRIKSITHAGTHGKWQVTGHIHEERGTIFFNGSFDETQSKLSLNYNRDVPKPAVRTS